MLRPIITFLLLGLLCTSPVQADEVLIRENAPERYTVVKGDTLWDIAGKFLKTPWRWPEIWQLNKEQIKDPHWIYPGDTVVLDRSGASPRLLLERDGQVLADADGNGLTRLSPRIRSGAINAEAIPSIPASAIAPFLSKPIVIDENGLAGSPHIVATDDSRVIVGAGDRAYVEGLDEQSAVKGWFIYRPSKALRDPDTDEIIAHEAQYIGEAVVKKPGDPATIEILRSKLEINRGDRMIPAEEDTLINYVPHAPDRKVSGRVVSAYEAVNEVAAPSIITLNLGKRDGMEIGHVLAAYRHGKWVESQWKKRKRVQLPDQRIGLVFVFRVFDRISYAMIVQSTRQFQVGDVLQTPPNS